MCLITAHAHALERVKELEAEVVNLKMEYEPVLPAGFPVFDIKWAELKSELESLGVQCMLKPEHVPDDFVRHTDEASWAKIMPFLVYPADLYVAGVADCDDYARWAASDSSKKFKLNGCLECWGDMPLGYHAFNLVRIAPLEYRLSDHNAGFSYAGELFKFYEHGYIPKYWRL